MNSCAGSPIIFAAANSKTNSTRRCGITRRSPGARVRQRHSLEGGKPGHVGWTFAGQLMQDLRYAVRAMMNNRAFTAMAAIRLRSGSGQYRDLQLHGRDPAPGAG
jgi:hypothetical protein